MASKVDDHAASRASARGARPLLSFQCYLTVNWLITGANGHLGRKLIDACGKDHRIVALVRSERALEQLSGLPCEVIITNYRDVAGLTAQLSGLDIN